MGNNRHETTDISVFVKKIATFMKYITKQYSLANVVCQIQFVDHVDKGLIGEWTPCKCAVARYTALTETKQHINIQFSMPLEVDNGCINMSVGTQGGVCGCILPSTPKVNYTGNRYYTAKSVSAFNCQELLSQLKLEKSVVQMLEFGYTH